MNYEPIKGVIQLSPEEAKVGALYLRCAIRNIKRAANLPLIKYKMRDDLSFSDHAMKNILDGAERMGIDLGGRWGNEIDSTEDT